MVVQDHLKGQISYAYTLAPEPGKRISSAVAMAEPETLSYRRIFLLWAPLALTWLMMALEGPFLAAVIARLAEPEYNLAAYGVAFSFAIIIEAPIIMMLSASTALVRDRDSFIKLRRFTYGLNTFLTSIQVVLLATPAFDVIALRWIRLPEPVARLTYDALIVLLPWTWAIGYRRFYQGLFIRHGVTRRVAYGTVVRLTGMSMTALVLYLFFDVPGAIVGGAALSVGVCSEAVASRLMVGGIARRVRAKDRDGDEPPLTYAQITSFYIPLALTSTITLAVHPMITFFLGQSRMAFESLVVYPVINALGFIFRSAGMSYQEVGIALLGKGERSFARLRNFALLLGLVSTSGLGWIAFTPLTYTWFHHVSGLSIGLSDFSRLPTQILTIMPLLSVLLSFERALLVHGRTTTPITYASLIEVTGIAVVLFAGIEIFDWIGAVAAIVALLLGRMAGNLYLIPYAYRVVRKSRL